MPTKMGDVRADQSIAMAGDVSTPRLVDVITPLIPAPEIGQSGYSGTAGISGYSGISGFLGLVDSLGYRGSQVSAVVQGFLGSAAQ